MSGGHFNYKQYEIGYIADEVEQLILDNDSEELDQWGSHKGCHFSEETIAEFKKGLNILRQAAIYAQRIDWLVSSDDGEVSFHRRLKKELENQEVTTR
jgi:hypothetical protein